ncbi:response regulator [Gloeothece verrucosa]|uniref:Response regulator receiver protein n=1 Tax=Gloeothece verrucosa (strain PCC 7822) TaxID=497965 RepID=E0ULR3_GLOV7|nr:response regulator [Gloeothece verrucosa]ADN17893.1 response regulator receiver protein [Gloeothece verrucosa PCC 7822]
MAKKRVLVIDDDAGVRTVVQGSLEDLAGWQVTTASTGYQGLLKANQEQFDVLILDIKMPGMNGLTVLKHLKENPKTRTLPVILLTAEIIFMEAESKNNIEIKGVITKPFNVNTLAQQIAKLVGWTLNEN